MLHLSSISNNYFLPLFCDRLNVVDHQPRIIPQNTGLTRIFVQQDFGIVAQEGLVQLKHIFLPVIVTDALQFKSLGSVKV